MLECVINVSEGRSAADLAAIADAAGSALLDVHTDPDHHRSVLTVIGVEAPRAIAEEAVGRLDLRDHRGAHPRIGVVDVVPFVALDGSDRADAVAARDDFCRWAGEVLGVPCFRYGEERSLPDVRRGAFDLLGPDCGPGAPHPSAGAMAVGARDVLVAYNVWLAEADLTLARQVAAELRSPSVRALGLQVGDHVQVSMNLIDPAVTGPGAVADAVRSRTEVARCELVGLVPRWVLDQEDPDRWDELDLGPERTIEHRVGAGGPAT